MAPTAVVGAVWGFFLAQESQQQVAWGAFQKLLAMPALTPDLLNHVVWERAPEGRAQAYERGDSALSWALCMAVGHAVGKNNLKLQKSAEAMISCF